LIASIVCGISRRRRRHHEDDDIGDVGAAHPHFGEGFVARRIEEGDIVAPLVLI
jgi:hypothetical protein